MDRRRLILSASALGAGGLAPQLIAGAVSAQTSLPPARPAAEDTAPPVYDPPASTGSGYAPPPYQPPAQRTPYQTQPPSSAYAAPPAYPQSQAQSQDSGPESRAPGTEGYDRQTEAARPPTPHVEPTYAASTQAETYSREELVNSVSDFLGVTAEAAGSAIERIFRDNGRPTGYIAGEEAAIAFTGGLRYGKGLLYMKNRQPGQVFWQGPSIGFDIRINASRVFTLCYNLQYPDAIFRRFPGVEGSAYFIGGLGINYQRAEDIVLSPIRAGVGLGAGINIGYLAYSRKRHWIPL